MTNRNQWSLVSIAAVVLFVVAAIFVGYSIITGEQMADMLLAITVRSAIRRRSFSASAA